MTPKTGIIPPNGFHFVEKHGTVERKITGSSYTDVAEQLLRYRIANKIPVGQPMDEIVAYVCGTWPHFCTATAPQVHPKTSEPAFTIAVMEWLKRLWERQAARPQTLAGDGEVARRAAVCHGCSFQKDWADYGCGSCVSSVRQQSYVFRAGRETPQKVTGCSILKQDNNAACFAPASSLPDATEAQRAALPSYCWRKSA
jgi:hypothetical protein